jgi:hypothetical protein
VNRTLGFHERTYRALLRVYPARFRSRFADEMVQLFCDQLSDARRERGAAGTAGTWLATLGDLALTAAYERTWRDRTVAHTLAAPPSAANRMLGILGILGGVVLVAAFIPNLPWGNALFTLRLVLFNAGAMAIVFAVHRRQAVIARRLSFLAAAPAILANAWYLVMVILSIGRPQFPEPDPEFRPIFFYAALALWLTDAAFGFVALRLGVVSRWGALALAIGSLLALTGVGGLGFTTGPFAAIIEPLSLVGIALVGIGWVLLGIDVATRRRPVPASTSSAT